MPSFCLYGMCHNLGSSTYQGYCNEYHMKRAWEREEKERVKLQASLSTIQKSSSLTVTLRDGQALTSSSRYEECTKSPHG